MDYAEYHTWVRDRLPLISDPIDNEAVNNCIKQDFQRGLTKEDCLEVMYLTEHVSPNLDEETACSKMNEIYAKYPKALYHVVKSELLE